VQGNGTARFYAGRSEPDRLSDEDDAQLRIYPDSGHGFLDQYPELFADHVKAFLNGG
jgi:pimeloyl-ACP methyl ester carboxylesterase